FLYSFLSAIAVIATVLAAIIIISYFIFKSCVPEFQAYFASLTLFNFIRSDLPENGILPLSFVIPMKSSKLYTTPMALYVISSFLLGLETMRVISHLTVRAELMKLSNVSKAKLTRN
ncbi:hypothetical protein A2U01_0046357, partial [Trifolium medium]|nr:hypothetical protein [Trifolium medium]